MRDAWRCGHQVTLENQRGQSPVGRFGQIFLTSCFFYLALDRSRSVRGARARATREMSGDVATYSDELVHYIAEVVFGRFMRFLAHGTRWWSVTRVGRYASPNVRTREWLTTLLFSLSLYILRTLYSYTPVLYLYFLSLSAVPYEYSTLAIHPPGAPVPGAGSEKTPTERLLFPKRVPPPPSASRRPPGSPERSTRDPSRPLAWRTA